MIIGEGECCSTDLYKMMCGGNYIYYYIYYDIHRYQGGFTIYQSTAWQLLGHTL